MLKNRIRLACVQMSAGENIAENLAKSCQWISKAKKKGADLVCLPEVFHYRGRHEWFPQVAQTFSSPLVQTFQRLAARLEIGVLLGSVIEKGKTGRKFYNTSIMISEKGAILGYYRKIHLFESHMKKKMNISESRHFLPGNKLGMAEFQGIKVGLTICYDIRFPELYRRLALAGTEIIFVPSNFTEITGQAHWQVLLRARAIENQVYIVAPAQVGKNPATGVKSFGESLIVDPWGEILAKGSRHREELIVATLDRKFRFELREQFPVFKSL